MELQNGLLQLTALAERLRLALGNSAYPHEPRKEVLAKGVSAESNVTPKKAKKSQGVGPSSAFGT